MSRGKGTTRRQFLCGCSAAVAAYAGSRFNTLAFADQLANRDHLVVVFLRGGMDGLSAFPPIGGSDRGHYEQARPTLQIPTSGIGAALQLDGSTGIHPVGQPLREVYQDGGLAVVQAVGRTEINRSHFDAMTLWELGATPSDAGSQGWLTRHLHSATNLPPDPQMPSLSMGGVQPVSLQGSYDTVNFAYPEWFNIDHAPGQYLDAQKAALEAVYGAQSSWLHDSGGQALEAMRLVEEHLVDAPYTPANGAVYPSTDFGDQMRIVAQIIKLGLGLQAATVDFGGWDTHEGQGTGSTGYFADLFGELSQGLAALYADLDVGSGADNLLRRTTVVVMSEFGRELRENSDNGTEHGYGNPMLVMGGSVLGGLHGSWPGLAPGALAEGTDLDVTTDYRRVLGEIVERRLCNPNLAAVFPGYTGYQPMGIVEDNLTGSGPDIFDDDFESGTTSSWSNQV